MTTDQLEFAISQYLDGTLGPLERQSLEAELATNPEAAKLLQEYRELDAVIKTSADLPSVDWEKFADHVSASVADEPISSRILLGTWGATFTRVAIAAVVILGVSLGLRTLINRPSAEPPTIAKTTEITPAIAPVELASKLEVTGPHIETSSASGIMQVSIGPSSRQSARNADWHAADAVVMRPSRVILLSANQTMGDSDRLPY